MFRQTASNNITEPRRIHNLTSFLQVVLKQNVLTIQVTLRFPIKTEEIGIWGPKFSLRLCLIGTLTHECPNGRVIRNTSRLLDNFLLWVESYNSGYKPALNTSPLTQQTPKWMPQHPPQHPVSHLHSACSGSIGVLLVFVPAVIL